MQPPHVSTVIFGLILVGLVLVLRLVFRGTKCERFGHIPNPGYGYHHKPIKAGQGYFKVVLAEIDGMGVQHASLYTECERCGVKYQVGRIHVPHQGQSSNLLGVKCESHTEV